ncbi:MAG: PIG-L family deacetylase [Candidatus Woesearchaeota archaeon]
MHKNKFVKNNYGKVLIVIEAHPDDGVFGAGGTIAKYVKEGWYVIFVTMSYGEASHIWLKRQEIIKVRVKENLCAQKILGSKEHYFLGLKEGNFLNDAKKKNIPEKLRRLIIQKNPSLIITHSPDDWNADHVVTSNLVTNVLNMVKKKIDVYCFDIWSPFSIKKTRLPKIYVNVSETFGDKIKALKCFKSQVMTFISIYWSVFTKAFFYGLQSKCKYAEVFYKLR